MKTTAQGIAAIEYLEGRRLMSYQDSIGVWTIGVGHKLLPSELESGVLCTGAAWREGITEAQRSALLSHDLATTENTVADDVTVTLLPSEFDALVSFTFNVGASAFQGSTLLRLLNQGDYKGVPVQMQRWVFAGGKEDPILERRRHVEGLIWTGVYPTGGTT